MHQYGLYVVHYIYRDTMQIDRQIDRQIVDTIGTLRMHVHRRMHVCRIPLFSYPPGKYVVRGHSGYIKIYGINYALQPHHVYIDSIRNTPNLEYKSPDKRLRPPPPPSTSHYMSNATSTST